MILISCHRPNNYGDKGKDYLFTVLIANRTMSNRTKFRILGSKEFSISKNLKILEMDFETLDQIPEFELPDFLIFRSINKMFEIGVETALNSNYLIDAKTFELLKFSFRLDLNEVL